MAPQPSPRQHSLYTPQTQTQLACGVCSSGCIACENCGRRTYCKRCDRCLSCGAGAKQTRPSGGAHLFEEANDKKQNEPPQSNPPPQPPQPPASTGSTRRGRRIVAWIALLSLLIVGLISFGQLAEELRKVEFSHGKVMIWMAVFASVGWGLQRVANWAKLVFAVTRTIEMSGHLLILLNIFSPVIVQRPTLDTFLRTLSEPAPLTLWSISWNTSMFAAFLIIYALGYVGMAFTLILNGEYSEPSSERLPLAVWCYPFFLLCAIYYFEDFWQRTLTEHWWGLVLGASICWVGGFIRSVAYSGRSH